MRAMWIGEGDPGVSRVGLSVYFDAGPCAGATNDPEGLQSFAFCLWV